MAAVGSQTIAVRGLVDLDRAFAFAGKEFSRELRAELRDVAEPVRADAELLAGTKIRNLHEGDPWSMMRAVARRNLVYVAPVERGLRTRKNPKIARPNLADLLMERAMGPALEAHTEEVVANFDKLVGDLGSNWEKV